MKQSASQPDDLLRTPEAAALLKNQAALRQLAQSPDTKRLLQLLQAQSGGGLEQAARQAGRGDPGALAAMLDGLLQNPEGAQLMERLNNSMPKQDC